MKPMIVSSCLVGCACRYDGNSVPDPLLKAIFQAGDLIPVCPEVMGGLETPREPAEIISEDPFQICTQTGVDVTTAYQRGAKMTVGVAGAVGAELAILKSKSPSCGSSQIYDGQFQRNLIAGAGITARTLREAGVNVINEETAKDRFRSLCTRILLLRHAESAFSADERGRGLTPEGEKMAQKLMKRRPEGIKPDCVYSSPYRRAIETARPWANAFDLEIIQDERLRERRVADDPVADFSSFAKRQWLDPEFSLPKGESLKDVADRGREAIRELESIHRGKTILIATHGTWMGALIHEFDRTFGYQEWKSLAMPDLWELIFYKGILVESKKMKIE